MDVNLPNDVVEICDFASPEGYRVVSRDEFGMDIGQENINSGLLLNFNVMFKLEQGWFLCKPVDLDIKYSKFPYIVQFQDGDQLRVYFDLEKYAYSVGVCISSWCLMSET